MTGETYLTADEVTKKYGDVTAVSEVSLDVPSDAVTGFIGPNGPGNRRSCACFWRRATDQRHRLVQRTGGRTTVGLPAPAADLPAGL